VLFVWAGMWMIAGYSLTYCGDLYGVALSCTLMLRYTYCDSLNMRWCALRCWSWYAQYKYWLMLYCDWMARL